MARNPAQEDVIRTTEGILLVDAGPGTGKTYTITNRYMSILDRCADVTTDDILLLTFSNNAADNMKRKVMGELVKRDPSRIWDVKISTFHAFCKSVLSMYSYKVPTLLDCGERLTPAFSVLENEIGEHMFFARVYNAFHEQHRELHRDMFLLVGEDTDQVLRTIKQLLSKGIFPTRDGWFLDGRSQLEGDWGSFSVRMRKENTCPMGKSGQVQCEMLKRMKSRQANKVYLDAPATFAEGKHVDEDLVRTAFDEDREAEIAFIHDIYHYYIRRAIRAGMLPFDFLIMLVFLILYDDEDIRASVSFDYVMVDEFQDTNEVQFMLTLLLMRKDNLCAVGDWKQGIYGFRYASIDNILEFDERIRRYKELLNEDRVRIPFPVDVDPREFTLNFRSTQKLLDSSFDSLYIEATNNDSVDAAALDSAITPLTAHHEEDHLSDVRFYTADDVDAEVDMIISLIQEMMDDRSDRIIEGGPDGTTLRPLRYEDIAVLTRTRKFGLRVQERAALYGVPVVFEGGKEIFNSEEGIVLLAWLRLLIDPHDNRAWAVLLEREGYSYMQRCEVMSSGPYPPHLMEKLHDLRRKEGTIIEFISGIYAYHDISTAVSHAIVHAIASVFSSTSISFEEICRFIEENIARKMTYVIDTCASEGAVTVQTLHGAKGLEYPVVILANCNKQQFPSSVSDTALLTYDTRIGLRCSKAVGTRSGYDAIFDNWRSDVLRCALPTLYDEERRLLFVGMTRARQYLLFTAHDPSPFFTRLAHGDVAHIDDPRPRPLERVDEEVPYEPPRLEYEGKTPRQVQVHALLDITTEGSGRGKEYGTSVHFHAERAALGAHVEPVNEDVAAVIRYVRSLDGATLWPETECVLPVGGVRLKGVIDLVAFHDDRIDIVDYKTDLTTTNLDEYRIQLSCYYHAVRGVYDRKVRCIVFYTAMDERIAIEPLTFPELEDVVASRLGQ